MALMTVDDLRVELSSRSFFNLDTDGKHASSFLLDKITFRLSTGEMLAIMGPNGSGKSTLLKALVGLIPLSRGEIKVDDCILNDVPTSKRIRHVGLSSQLVNNQFHSLTVFNEIWQVIQARHSHVPREEQEELLTSVINQFNLQSLVKVNPYFLSGGEKRRLVLAILTLLRPTFYLFDEPTMGLDMMARTEFKTFLWKLLHGHHHGVIMATHDLEFLLPFDPSVLLLNQGKPSFYGKMHELLLTWPLQELVQILTIPHWVLLLLQMTECGIIDRKEFVDVLKDQNRLWTLLEEIA